MHYICEVTILASATENVSRALTKKHVFHQILSRVLCGLSLSIKREKGMGACKNGYCAKFYVHKSNRYCSRWKSTQRKKRVELMVKILHDVQLEKLTCNCSKSNQNQLLGCGDGSWESH